MLRKLILSAVGAFAMASSASAADIYTGDGGSFKDTPHVPAFSWTGFYVGVNVGYAWGQYDNTGLNGEGFDGEVDALNYKADGVLVGGQIGHNWQRGNLLYGVEGEIGRLGAEGDQVVRDEGSDDTSFSDTKFGAYGVVAARLGFASDRTLLYVKGGLALASVDTNAGNTGDENDATRLDETLIGYAIGGGVEYALSQNWAIKTEYLYMNFGDEKSSNAEGDTYTHEVGLHTAKIGVNYKFGSDYEALK